MKKIFSALLALTLAVTAFALMPTEYEGTNVQRELMRENAPPVADGYISDGEYGHYPIEAWSYGDYLYGDEDIFYTGDPSYAIEDDQLGVAFFATWDDNNLYLAWKIYTKYDSRVPYDDNEHIADYCCLQLMITPGAPNNGEVRYQTNPWGGNYFEAAIALDGEGYTQWTCWTVPEGWNYYDWVVIAHRSETEQATVYECSIPWENMGIYAPGTGTQFGLNFGVCAQENANYVPGMVEYVDGIFGTKNADNAVCFTLLDNDDVNLEEGQPEVYGETVKLDQLNTTLQNGKSLLVTNPEDVNRYFPGEGIVALMRPLSDVGDLDGHYRVMEVVWGAGGNVVFETPLERGDVAVIASSSGEGSPGEAAVELLASLLPGESQLYLFGYCTADGVAQKVYSNSCVVLLTEDQYIDVETPPQDSLPQEEPSLPEDDNPEDDEDYDDDEDNEEDEEDEYRQPVKETKDSDNSFLIMLILIGTAVFEVADVILIVWLLKRR